jgi:hypothetical protein
MIRLIELSRASAKTFRRARVLDGISLSFVGPASAWR